MAKNENKILEELRRRGKIYEDPAPRGCNLNCVKACS